VGFAGWCAWEGGIRGREGATRRREDKTASAKIKKVLLAQVNSKEKERDQPEVWVRGGGASFDLLWKKCGTRIIRRPGGKTEGAMYLPG